MKVAIIGAGLAGLAAGRHLQQAGCDVEIFEAADRPGGRAITINRPGSDDIVDSGTQYFHSNYRRALKLIDDAGLSGSLRKVKGTTRFFDQRVRNGSFTSGHRIPYIASGSWLANLQISLRGLWHMATNPIDPYAVQKSSAIDNVLAAERIKDPFEWEYSVRTLVAAGALVEPDKKSVSFLHLIRLMRIIVMTDYLVLDGGIASLHEKLAADLPIQFETPVERLVIENSKVSGVVTRDGKHSSVDAVIVATTPGSALKLLPANGWGAERAFLASIKHPPAIVLTFFTNKKMPPRVWSHVFRPDSERLVSFCTDAAQKNPAMTPSGLSAFQAWICSPAADRVANLPDTQLAAQVLAELAEHFPDLEDSVQHMHVHRVADAVPQCPPGHNGRAEAFFQAADKRSGIEFCGDYFSGGYMESALWSVERAVGQILARRNLD